MNSDQILGLIFAVTLINFLGLILIGVRGETRANNNNAYEKRLAILETAMVNMPSHSDMSAMRDRIAGIDGKLGGVAERLTGQNDMLRTIHSHLLQDD